MDVRVRFLDVDSKGPEVVLPATALKLLLQLLTEMRNGRGIILLAEAAELTTQQAAYTLNISRSTLLKLLDAGDLPFHWVGTHRRLLMEDVMWYKQHHEERQFQTDFGSQGA